jgi:aspartyl-tRNA(Asn)/glutamyl-tRNA(Gln) amidotransferase subunit B
MLRLSRLHSISYLGRSTFIRSIATTSKIKEGWETVIGIEVHAQLNTKTKLFSGKNPPLCQSKNSVGLFSVK